MDIPADAPATRGLSPAEVHNVAFKKPPIGKRGYDEEEVDNFLDVVETELARLIEENESLRRKGVALDPAQHGNISDEELIEENARLAEALAKAQNEHHATVSQLQQDHVNSLAAAQAAGSGDDDANTRLQEALQNSEQRVQAAEQRAQAAEQAALAAQEETRTALAKSPSSAPAEHHEQAVKMLALAQQTADQHLAAAKSEADTMVTEAKAAAEQLQEESTAAAQQLHQESTVAAEQLHQESTAAAEARVTEAQTAADTLQRDSDARAAKTIQDAEQHAAAVTEALETRKAALERRLEELGIFEREYRSRLKSYLESQLRDLEHGADDLAPEPKA